ncbi:hypothetical protein [Curtobacterium sp. VKM Ac-1395]|uniref:hypothetical protein n=1 Tax=Curtobacterium sp. VKM Ac-1395 TaxID=2783815 RepID=UPI00188AAB1D|nr:hypothetical protein [Curtobacterium sp. VKM Ac-1395]MBF4588683.1 hypothetical protein [Curtobacterium sp. VKM Ac-1395]
MDEALLYDLCSRARLIEIRLGGSDGVSRGLTDLISRAADPAGRYSHAQLLALMQSTPRPVGFRYGLRRLEALTACRTDPPEDFSDEQRAAHAAAQSALLEAVGRDCGEPPHGVVAVARNVLEQFGLRWF